MTPHKSDACRKEIETLLEYDMIEPSKSPWACGVVMAKKKGDQLRFCCDFRYLNSVTVKDAYPIPRIDESLSKLGDAKFFTTLDLGSAFWQVPLRKQDRDKTGFACELGLFQWKRMPFGLCNATATFQRLMAHALIGVTKKYGNLVMCYVDDVVIATPTLEDHIERLDEVFACMKRSGLKCKPSKCEILKDSIKYLGRMVDKHGIRPDPDAVEAVLTWKSPKTEHQLMSFLGFANYYREFIKGYADKVYPMQQLMRHKGKKFTWNNAAEESFQRIKKELCEAPVLGMPTEKGMYVLDTDASVVAISGILHQEQEWNGKTVLRPIAYGSKVLSDTEMKYGAPKAEMFAVVTFVEKYRAYLGSEPFKLRVDNRALSWLKTYSMDQSYIGRWIVRLDGYNMIIEHRTRDKHQNADSLSKKTEFYERQEQREADRPEIKDGFSFMDKETYDSLPLTRWLDKSGKPIEDHPELPKEPLEKKELEKIAVSRKPLRELSCNSNVRTNLVPEDDMKIVKRMICVKLSDDIHNPGEMNGQIMALKEHVKARYRLSDLIRAQKNDKMTSNLSKWIHSGVKEKGELEEDSYKILSQFYKEKRDLLYHTAEGVVACKRRDEEKILHKHNLIILPQLYQTEVLFRSHDQMGHQGIDKVQQRILHRFDWPGMRKACERWVNACLACLQVKDPRKMKFPLKSVESSEFNEVVQIDHQKICMTESGYNQILVIIDHFTKLAEAVPCQTASAEETCDHLITHWISRYGCPMTFQSDNGKAFVGDLTKELMKRSHIAQAHSTTYHPQTNGLVERQNRTLVNMLRVYCSRYMTDWDKYLPQVVGAYNSTQHSTTGISPFMMLTGRERAMPITFFYPEYEGKRTSPQAYVKEAIKRQQELNELCRRNTAQAQMRQRKKYDEKILRAKPYEVGQYVWVFQNVIPPKGTKKLLKKWRGPFMITEVHQQGRFYRLSTGRAAHYENLKPHVPSPEDWCLPKDMEGLEYLVVEPACEVNEKGTREKNDGNENLSLDDNEKIEVESDAGSFVEEDWNDPEQNEVPKWMEPDRPTPPETRTGNRKRTGMRYNRYGDDFLIDKIQPDKLGDELLSAGELEAEEEWQVIDDGRHYPQDDYSTPELETDLEQSEIERRENTNLRILEWMRDVKDESREGQSIQQIDVSAANYMKTEDPLFGWTATDRPLDIPKDNSDPTTSTGTSINIFVRGVGVGLTHTENLMIKKLKEVRETSGLELEEEEPEPTIGRNFKTKFEIPNEYSENIMITDSDFILSNRTSAICITADMSFKSRLEADFKREYQNVEFLFRQRPGLGGMAALPPSLAQVPGKYLCFLVTRVNDRNTIDPEHVILALTRLRDFMIERGIVEVSMPVYDPNRGKLSSRELYAILHVVFVETEIMVHLHKKYYLSIA